MTSEGDEGLKRTADERLMERVANGDEAATFELVQRWQQPLLNFFYRSLQSRADAEDLAQSVFIKICRAASRYKATAKFSTYLFHIARRVLLNELRRRSRKPLHLVEPQDFWGESDPTDAATMRELEEIFRAGLEGMPENQRTAILLLKQQELSYGEIAGVMNSTESQVKTWIFRARQRLKAELEKHR